MSKKGLNNSLTLFFIFTKITMQMAMRINVTTTPTSTPRTGVICTRTARDDAAKKREKGEKKINKNFKIFFFLLTFFFVFFCLSREKKRYKIAFPFTTLKMFAIEE